MNLRISPVVAGTVASLTGVANAEAQSITGLRDKFFGGGEEVVNTASAGNGGVVTAAANSGAVSAGDINSGGNVCNAIGVGNTYGYPVCGQVRLAGFRARYPYLR